MRRPTDRPTDRMDVRPSFIRVHSCYSWLLPPSPRPDGLTREHPTRHHRGGGQGFPAPVLARGRPLHARVLGRRHPRRVRLARRFPERRCSPLPAVNLRMSPAYLPGSRDRPAVAAATTRAGVRMCASRPAGGSSATLVPGGRYTPSKIWQRPVAATGRRGVSPSGGLAGPGVCLNAGTAPPVSHVRQLSGHARPRPLVPLRCPGFLRRRDPGSTTRGSRRWPRNRRDLIVRSYRGLALCTDSARPGCRRPSGPGWARPWRSTMSSSWWLQDQRRGGMLIPPPVAIGSPGSGYDYSPWSRPTTSPPPARLGQFAAAGGQRAGHVERHGQRGAIKSATPGSGTPRASVRRLQGHLFVLPAQASKPGVRPPRQFGRAARSSARDRVRRRQYVHGRSRSSASPRWGGVPSTWPSAASSPRGA